MPFKKGTPKPLGSGRVKGVSLKPKVVTILSKDVASRLEELGCDPITGLATLALDPMVDDGIRRLCFADLMKYIYPQKRSIEHTGQINTIGVTFNGDSALRALEDRIAGIRERNAIALRPGVPE